MTPPTSDQPRPVWLTQDERDAVNRARYTTRMTRSSWDAQTLRGIVAAWDAAPADPAEAMLLAIVNYENRYDRQHTVDAVLRALGAPNTNQDTNDA